jgi:hypothetical protein
MDAAKVARPVIVLHNIQWLIHWADQVLGTELWTRLDLEERLAQDHARLRVSGPALEFDSEQDLVCFVLRWPEVTGAGRVLEVPDQVAKNPPADG